MKKCCFIIPYFGKLPSFFPIFVKTCEKNQDYDWLILSDNNIEFMVPNNVILKKICYEELQEKINKKMGFECNFSELHKLCDYKPAYGFIFEEYIKDYKFWGHCDLDIILGDLNKFITDDMLEIYDKIFCLGHMVLYKNTYDNNRLFMKPLSGEVLYKKVFTSPETLIFDETYGGKKNINSIFVEQHKKVYFEDLSFNVKIFPTRFVRTKFNYEKYGFENEKYKNALYTWNNGKLYRYFIENKKIEREEFLYMHFQQRNMRWNNEILKCSEFKIVPNSFLTLEYSVITEDNFYKIRKHIICFHSFSKRIEWKRKALSRRLKKWLK